MPAVGEVEGGVGGDAAQDVAGGIEDDGVPLQVEHVGGHDDAAFGRGQGGEELEVDVDGGGAVGDGDVEGVHVDGVAAPGQCGGAGADGQAGELLDGAGGAVIAGDPLGVEEDEVVGAAAAGGLFDGEGFVDGEDVAGEVGRVDGEAERAGVVGVGGLGERRRKRLEGGERWGVGLGGAWGEGGQGEEGESRRRWYAIGHEAGGPSGGGGRSPR